MKNKSKILIQILILLLNQKLFAQTILVPEKNISELHYLEQCRKTGYVCSHDFLAEQINSVETVRFNTLIENLDLLSESSRQNVASSIQQILKTEMISVDQLKTLIQITDKSTTIDNNKKTQYVKSEMLSVMNTIENMSDSGSEFVTYIVFKKRLNEIQFRKLYPMIQSMMFYKIDPYSFTEKTTKPVFLLNGNCDQYQISTVLSERFNAKQTIPVFKHECNFNAEIQKSITSVKKFTIEYKKPLIWTVLAAGAYLFIKNYDVEIK